MAAVIINERADAMSLLLDLASGDISTTFALDTFDVRPGKWSGFTSGNGAGTEDLHSADGSPNFLMLAFWAQSSGSWPASGDNFPMDVAVFARQVDPSTGTSGSAITPLVIFHVSWFGAASDLLLSAGAPVSGADGGDWYMASRFDFSLPLAGGGQVWPAQNPAQATLLQQNAASGWVQIPLRGFNQVAVLVRMDSGVTKPGKLLVARLLR